MGIIGVLLAGAFGSSPGTSDTDELSERRGMGATVKVGSSLGAAKQVPQPSGKKKKQAAKIAAPAERHVRVLIVAPSNAAVDELVLRLCEAGVPGTDGRPFFPKVVRIGADRRSEEEEDGVGERGGLRQASASAVQVRSGKRFARKGFPFPASVAVARSAESAVGLVGGLSSCGLDVCSTALGAHIFWCSFSRSGMVSRGISRPEPQ